MIVGHYAAALVPYTRNRSFPLWLLLLCANLPEFLWLGLSLAGLERPAPDSILDATFQNLVVEMTFSHNLLPALLQAALTAAVVQLVWKQRRLTLWCAGLVVLHVLCDYVVGFEHQLAGPDSLAVALNTYGSVPALAITIELAFAAACLVHFDWGRARAGTPLRRKPRIALYLVVLGGIAVWYPTATMPLSALF